jgi:mono/diheme cytochrome c family protein
MGVTNLAMSSTPETVLQTKSFAPARRWILVLGAVMAVLAVWLVWQATEAVPSFHPDDPRLEGGDATQGAMVFAAGQCSSCHASPGQSDRLKLGGGMALASPFGTFRVPNLSPHPADGIGAWKPADLANALMSGVSPERQHYYPALPYAHYTGMTLTDVRDLFAYLLTLEPVAGRAPPHDLPLLFRIRRGIGVWKLLFFRQGQWEATLTGDAVHDRGAYLVETLGHCAECHSSRNILGAIKPSTRFAGGTDPEGTGFVPNITPNRIGNWTEADIARMLKTGETPNHGRVGSSMTDVVTNMALLPQSDRDAIARYIKALPPRPTPHP